MSSTLGKNIKAYRKNKGLTQEELANLLNITPQAISKWESESGLPDVSMLIPLAKILGVSTDALLGYDTLSANAEITDRVREEVIGLSQDKDRPSKTLKICEYLATQTNLNPGNFDLISDYIRNVADLSMYADKKLEGCYQDEIEKIEEIYADAIRKGAYLIGHCADRELVYKAHFSLAWIYIHKEDFDNAKAHIDVLPSLSAGEGGIIKERIDISKAYFEGGMDAVHDVVSKNAVLLFNATSSMLLTISELYGWWDEPQKAYEICDWCEEILKAYATRKESIDMVRYLRCRRSVAFFKMVAAKRSGDTKKAEELYSNFARQISEEDLTDEEKEKVMELLHNDINYYSKYS